MAVVESVVVMEIRVVGKVVIGVVKNWIEGVRRRGVGGGGGGDPVRKGDDDDDD